MFFICSICKIIFLYLFIQVDQFAIKLMYFNLSIIISLYGFALTYLFSLEIESAHQSHRLIDSVLCKYEMELSLRLKVNGNSNFIKYLNELNLAGKFHVAIDRTTDWFVLLQHCTIRCQHFR